MHKLLISIVAAAVLSGCTFSPNEGAVPQKERQASIAESMYYFKDKHGLCYAAIESGTYSRRNSVSITAVPCEKVGL